MQSSKRPEAEFEIAPTNTDRLGLIRLRNTAIENNVTLLCGRGDRKILSTSNDA